MSIKKYLVVGLGITGVSAVEYLLKQNAFITVTDSRESPPQIDEFKLNFPKVPVFLGSLHIPADTTHILLSPGVPLTTPEIQTAIARGITVLGDIEMFAQTVNKPVIAVTGSNGKTTTASLLALMAQASGIQAGVGGNEVGKPALALLDPKHEMYILELSSFQLETTQSLNATAVTILNISADHMDRYADVPAYQQAKQRVYLNANAAVVNRQDPLTFVPPTMNVARVISFGLDEPQGDNYGIRTKGAQTWLAKGESYLLPVKDMAILGAHNVANALAALALGELAGFDLQAMLNTLRTFTGLEHRCEKVINARDVVWVNDSKGTNVGATLAAIEGLANSIPGKWVIILGGVGKNANFTPLIAPIAKTCKAAILIGEDGGKLGALLQGVLPCFNATNFAEVVQIAQQQTQAGDGVLLSPACASLDMFTNYKQRGEVFKQHVLRGAVENSTIPDINR